MQFKEIIGQEEMKAKLTQAVRENRISHAMLLAGPEGNGKLALALAFSQYINCTNKTETDSCGVCPSCVKMNKLIHPDFHFTYPIVQRSATQKCVDLLPQWRKEIGKSAYLSFDQWKQTIEAGNTQPMIYAKESEEIIAKLTHKSFESEYKVMLVWLPEKMNVSCANKLLKLIEEPADKTLLLFVSESEKDILGTIRSRVQLWRVPRIQTNALETYLQENHPGDPERNAQIAKASRGNYHNAMSHLFSDEQKQFNLENFQNVMRLSYGRKVLDILKWADNLAEIGREQQKTFLTYSINFLRENFIYNLGDSTLNFMNSDQEAFSAKFSPFINEKNIQLIYNEFHQANQDIIMNGNPKIVFTHLGLMITKYIRP